MIHLAKVTLQVDLVSLSTLCDISVGGLSIPDFEDEIIFKVGRKIQNLEVKNLSDDFCYTILGG